MSDQRISPDDPRFYRLIDGALGVQRPLVLAHVRKIRRRYPSASPAEVIRILEKNYLTAVTTGGAAVGASSAIPAVGITASLGLSAVETAGFLEVSGLFAQAVTEVHGIAVEDPDRARALVMTMILGSGGSDLVRQLAAQVTGEAPAKNANWGELITKTLPSTAMGSIADRIKQTFIRRFARAQGGRVLGRVIPFGVGAVIGGAANNALGRKVIENARTAFGQAPDVFPPGLEPVYRADETAGAASPRRGMLRRRSGARDGAQAELSGFVKPRRGLVRGRITGRDRRDETDPALHQTEGFVAPSLDEETATATPPSQ
ncbi:hypothetical protein ACFFGH_12725 [Lysobacter korlensis]|uniref:Di-and tripeptidase n=1 Tax=Lysobacter korlensis TaxID=553636 RepID=A0ABV6RNY6_9GAMM